MGKTLDSECAILFVVGAALHFSTLLLGEWQQTLPINECPLIQYLMYKQLLKGCTKWIKIK